MKQPKKLKLKHKKLVSHVGLNPDNWMLRKEEPGYIVIVNKQTQRTRILAKI